MHWYKKFREVSYRADSQVTATWSATTTCRNASGRDYEMAEITGR